MAWPIVVLRVVPSHWGRERSFHGHNESLLLGFGHNEALLLGFGHKECCGRWASGGIGRGRDTLRGYRTGEAQICMREQGTGCQNLGADGCGPTPSARGLEQAANGCGRLCSQSSLTHGTGGMNNLRSEGSR